MNTRWDLIRMEKMTWMDFAQKTDSFIILPVGSMEQHGPHLPLNVDSVIAENFSFRLAEELDAVVAPTLKLSLIHISFCSVKGHLMTVP